MACYLYVALQRLLQNKNSSGAQRKPHLSGDWGKQDTSVTLGTEMGTPKHYLREIGRLRPLSGECMPS